MASPRENLDQELSDLVESAHWVERGDEWIPTFPLAPKGPDGDTDAG